MRKIERKPGKRLLGVKPHDAKLYRTNHARFDREARSLRKRQPDFTKQLAVAIDTLRHDPYNRSRTHTIKKLEAVPPGEGQYRLRLRRFRFRYDIEGNTVTLRYCGLRREDTYR